MRSPSVSGILVCDFELRRTQRPARKDPHQVDRQILANSFDVFRRCIRRRSPTLSVTSRWSWYSSDNTTMISA